MKEEKGVGEFLKRYPKVEEETIAIVTGANSGIGYGVSNLLSRKGVKVIMACRNLNKGELAISKIRLENPTAELDLMELDVSSLKSVNIFAEKFRAKYGKLNLLINNAGVMAIPYSTTVDGFETQFGTNHLGHFALTGLLLDLILSSKGSRVISTSSIAHFKGEIYFDDINLKEGYTKWSAYRQSKLANLIFAYELDRRFKKAGKEAIALSAHPGVTSTNIMKIPPILEGLKAMVLMSEIKGSLSTFMSAMDKDLRGGEFIGPDGRNQTFGFPKIQRSSDYSYKSDIWLRLWEESEKLTGIKYNI